MKSKRVDILRRALKVIFAGGGAYYLENKRLPKNALFTGKPYEYSNVRGYYEHHKDKTVDSDEIKAQTEMVRQRREDGWS